MKVSSLLYDDANGTLRKNIDNVAIQTKKNADAQAEVVVAYASQTIQRNQQADDKAHSIYCIFYYATLRCVMLNSII
jgi:hypothetical protein